jgi:hypothetical protein
MISTTPVLEAWTLVTIATPPYEATADPMDDKRVVGKSLRRGRKSP